MDTPEESKAPARTPEMDSKCFRDILKTLVGNVITVVNPESYEEMPVGHQIKPGFYRAKVLTLGEDFIAVVSEHQHAGKNAKKEPVKQFVPIREIKRLSILKSERLIHL
jgi:hypothetical protein